MKRNLCLLILCALFVSGQTPKLIKDINPYGDSWGEFIDYELDNGSKLLLANDSIHESQLWITDGTSDGTKILKLINPNGDSFEGTEFLNFKNELYFFANDGVHGAELWKTNGTESGTQLVKDINPLGGQENPDETNFVVIGDKFYFVAGDGTHGKEVWVSDGTETGTKMLIDINPSGSINSMGQIEIHALKNSLIFLGKYKNTTYLWNVTSEGDTTSLIKFSEWSSMGHEFAFEDKLYFRMYEHPQNNLYVTDGTRNGTKVFEPLLFNGDYAVLGKDLYFIGDNNDQRKSSNLWKLSSKTHDLSLVKKISSQQNINNVGMDTINNKLVFFAEHDTLGYVLYTSDGTSDGTKVLHDFSVQKTGGASDNYSNFYHFDGELYISTQIDSVNSSLYKTDGETVDFLYDFNPGQGYGDVWSFGTIKNELYMIADGKDVGLELFKYDGTTGIDDEKLQSTNLVFPNPAKDMIHLSVQDIEGLKITSLNGAIIKELWGNQNLQLVDVSQLQKGMYLMEVHTKDGKVIVQKFIKE